MTVKERLELDTEDAERDIRKLGDLIEKNLKTAAGGLDLDLDGSSREVRKLGALIDNEIKLDKGAIGKDAAADLDDITTAAKKTERSIDGLDDAFKDAGSTRAKARDVNGRFVKSNNDLNDSLGKQDKLMKGGAAAGKALAAGLTAVAGGAALAITAAVKLNSEFAEFEKSITEVRTLLPELSDEGFGQMQDDVLELGVSIGRLSSDTVPALYSALSAGVPEDNALTFLADADILAKAGVSTLEESVDLLTSSLNAYGQEATNASDVSDLLFTTVKAGKTTIPELSANISNVAPIASDAGVALQDVLEAIADLTLTGTPTAQATTQIRAAIGELAKTGTVASDVFKELTGETFREFIASGGTLEDAFKRLEGGARTAGVSIGDMFGSQEAGQAAAQLAEVENFTDVTGAAQLAADEYLETTAGQMARAQASFERVRLELGEAVTPAFLELAKVAEADLVPVIRELTPLIADFATEYAPELGKQLQSVAGIIQDLTPVIEVAFKALVFGAERSTDAWALVADTIGNVRDLATDISNAWKIPGVSISAVTEAAAELGGKTREAGEEAERLESRWAAYGDATRAQAEQQKEDLDEINAALVTTTSNVADLVDADSKIQLDFEFQEGEFDEIVKGIDDLFQDQSFGINTELDDQSLDAALADLNQRLAAEANRIDNLNLLRSLGADDLAENFKDAPELLQDLVNQGFERIASEERKLDISLGRVDAQINEGETEELARRLAEAAGVEYTSAFRNAIPDDLLVEALETGDTQLVEARIEGIVESLVAMGAVVEGANGELVIDQASIDKVEEARAQALLTTEAFDQETILKINTDKAQKNLEAALADVKALNGEDLKDKTAIAEILTRGQGDLSDAQSSLDALNNKSVQVEVASLGLDALTNIKRTVDSLESKTLTVTVLAKLTQQALDVLAIPGIELSGALRYGDVVTSPGIYAIGEGRGPEAVVPMAEGPEHMMNIIRQAGMVQAMAPHLSATEFAQIMAHAPSQAAAAPHVSVSGGWSGPTRQDIKRENRRHTEMMNGFTRLERQMTSMGDRITRATTRQTQGAPRAFPLGRALVHAGVN